MKKSIIVGLMAVVLLAAGVLAYAEKQEESKIYSWRYKVIVSVDTPEGLKTGSAVREAIVKFEPRPGYKPHPYHVTTKVKGEAVVVDLGERGVLFALIDPDDYRFLFEAFPGPPGLTVEGAEFYSNLSIGKKSILNDHFPWLVTFLDSSDPKTIKAINKDNIRKILGKDTILSEISIEMTNEPVTWGKINQFLKWFGKEKIGSGFWDPNKPEQENYLTSSDFRLGEKE